MKKIIFSLLAIVISAFAVSADRTVTTVTITYYGEKANSNGSNPCAGSTTSVCATVTKEIVVEDDGWYEVIESTYDAAGSLTGKTVKRTTSTPDEIIAEETSNLPENAIASLSEYAEPAQ